MKRSPLLRRTPLVSHSTLRRTPLASISPRERARQRDYRKVRVAYMAGHPLCELCEEAPSAELHHKRGRVGADLTNADHFAALCGFCHRYLTESPAEAYRLGMSERRIGGAA